MVCVSKFLAIQAATLLAGAIHTPDEFATAPFKMTTSMFGPLNTWRAIKATEADPKGIFEGLPANDSVIIGYEPPQMNTKETQKNLQRVADRITAAESSPNLALAGGGYQFECFSYTGPPVWVNQLYSGKDYFCTLANRTPLRPGQYYGTYLDYYLASDGTWQRFRNQGGREARVWYMVSLNPGFSWGVGNCLLATQAVLYYCHTDFLSQGGRVYNHPGGMDAAIAPA